MSISFGTGTAQENVPVKMAMATILGEQKMTNIREEIEQENPQALFANGLDGAIIGFGGQYTMLPVVVYDYDKCVDILMKDNEWNCDEAFEWMEFNVVTAYVGPGTPIFIKRVEA